MYSKIIIKPILTEKMAILEERENKHAFLVYKNANKAEIKKAIEKKFDVKVVKVATINQLDSKTDDRAKWWSYIRTSGKQSDFKKQ